MKVRRGHLLLEVTVSGAVFLVAIGGLLGGLNHAARDLALARSDQEAIQVARGQLDLLLAQPSNAPAWAASVKGPNAVPGHPAVTLTLTITDVIDGEVVGTLPPTYKRAVARAESHGRSVVLEALKW